MTITVGWATDQVITVNKVDMVLVQSTPREVYELDVDGFFSTLKDLERSEEGMPWPDTQRNASPVTLAGQTYARNLEIIPPYTLTFEDGQYTVTLTGANSNIVQRTNPNQVSVLGNNSAGLIQSQEVTEIHTRLGLETGNPITDVPGGITDANGTIDIDRTGDGVTSSTLTRQ